MTLLEHPLAWRWADAKYVELPAEILTKIHMDAETFQNLARVIQRLHTESSDGVWLVVIPLLFGGAVGGMLVARWVFRGGLSRSGFLLRR